MVRGLSLANKILYWVEEEGIVSATNRQIAERFDMSDSNYISKQVSNLVNEGKIIAEIQRIPGQGQRRILKATSFYNG